MGYLKYVREFFKGKTKEYEKVTKERLQEFRKEPATVRIERPTNIAKARTLGYRPKPGVIVVRQRVTRGGRQRPDIKGGRRSAHSSQRKVVKKSYQQIAEERANKKYKNCEVINSYKIAQDGQNYWYEIIMIERYHPAVLSDKQLAQIAVHKGRAYRGKTSAGRKSRGLRKKGLGAEKVRPSLRTKNRVH